MRIRVGTRRLMIVVALAAVALATPGELRARRERRDWARTREYHLKYAAIHDKERAACESPASRRPYNWESRRDSQGGNCYSLSFPRFTTGPEEARWHAEAADECRARAVEAARAEQAVRRRLIFPVLFDINRTAQ